MDEESDQEKTEEPSAHRIEEFKRKGEVSSSKELTSVLIVLVAVMTLSISILFIYEELESFLRWILTLNISSAFTEKSLETILYKALKTGFICAAPVALVSLCVGILSGLGQLGFIFAPEVLEWKIERLDPIKGFKRLFSMKSLVEAIKGILKFLIVLIIVYVFIKDDMRLYIGFFHMDLFQSFLYGKTIILKLSMSILLGLLVVAIGDFFYQKFTYKKKIMMTKEEVKKESKDQEGNPEIKQRIKQIQKEQSLKRMIADIPNADVIITNPTHISIVLKYDSRTMTSPVITGKGADHMAMKIREIAKKHNIPMVENIPLARSLYKVVKVGETVPRALYEAVAEVLIFVYKLKKKNVNVVN